MGAGDRRGTQRATATRVLGKLTKQYLSAEAGSSRKTRRSRSGISGDAEVKACWMGVFLMSETLGRKIRDSGRSLGEFLTM
jgi:hypothetical protein